MFTNQSLDDNEFYEIYKWVDSYTLSKTRKNINRDFSDGTCYAEIIKKNIPSLVQINNYIPTENHKQKLENWNLLNNKVLKKLGFKIKNEDIEGIISSKPYFIEKALKILKIKIEEYKKKSIENNKNLNENSINNILNEPLTKEIFYKKELLSKEEEIKKIKIQIKVYYLYII